jgi:hypothetical protein
MAYPNFKKGLEMAFGTLEVKLLIIIIISNHYVSPTYCF